jgi:hypothetical protein
VRRTIVSSAIAAFLITRALVFGAIILGAQFTFLGKTYSSSVWETRITLSPARVASSLGLQTMTGDAWWYRSIAESGYTSSGPAQNAWGRTPGAFWRPLVDYLQHPLAVSEPWNFVLFNFGVALLLFAAGTAFLIRRRWSLAAYTFLSVLLPLSSGSLQSLGRYAMTAFPLFLWLATITRNSIAARVVTIVSAALLGWFLALLALRVDITLA